MREFGEDSLLPNPLCRSGDVLVNRGDSATEVPVEGSSVGGWRRGAVAQTVDPDRPGLEP